LGLMQTSLRFCLSRMLHGRHIKEQRHEIRIGGVNRGANHTQRRPGGGSRTQASGRRLKTPITPGLSRLGSKHMGGPSGVRGGGGRGDPRFEKAYFDGLGEAHWLGQMNMTRGGSSERPWGTSRARPPKTRRAMQRQGKRVRRFRRDDITSNSVGELGVGRVRRP
jgi:hypothetical protein